MEWTEFLNDPELNSATEYHLRPNGNYLSGKVLHDVLECLTAYRGWIHVISEMKLELPEQTSDWLVKRNLTIEEWVSEITPLSNTLKKDLPDTSLEWPNLIAKVGQIVAEAPMLQREAKALILPTPESSKRIVQAMVSAIARLNLILRDIEAKEYKRLWTVMRYGDLLKDRNDF